ncbi:MAG: response regulator [Endomicrobium sp.]|jgi:DNA-binding response OmpR family regulator|nr:response regulator [Endomicrobium sp.]
MIKILLVDDEVFIRDNFAKFIESSGFSVCVADSAEEALEVFKNEKPDVVFLDLMLPDLDGDHLFSYFKELDPFVEIYFITGSDTVFTEKDAKELGAAGYLKKPVYRENLVKLLEEIKSKVALSSAPV